MPQLCLNPNELNAFLLGKMSSEERLDAVAGHLDGCSRCQSAAESMEPGRDSILAGLQAPSRSDSFFSDTGIQQFLKRAKNLVRPAAPDQPTYADATIDFLPNRGQIRDCKLLHPIGQGGMGTVYKANHTVLGRTVAVKVLPPDRMDVPQAVGRFQKEMQAVGQVNHAHIVQAHDAGIEDGVHFLVMEYVEGADLKQVMRNQSRLSVADACEVIRQAALGLHGVMENGLVHRDIKPSNLMLTPQGRIKILDLGLARLAPSPTAARPVADMTFSGQLLGTVDYMSPEQIEASDKADIRADIYSLGCTFYHLLTGRVPFEGDVGDKLESHRMKEPTPIDVLRPDIPRKLVEVVQKMMRKNPAERFAEPQDVADAVKPFCKSARLDLLLRDAKPRPAIPVRPPSVWGRRPIWLGIGIAAASLLLTAFFVLRVRTPHGTLELEFPSGVPKNVQVYVDGDRVVVERIDNKKAKITVAVGKRDVVVKEGNTILDKKTVRIGHKGLPPMLVKMKKASPPKKNDLDKKKKTVPKKQEKKKAEPKRIPHPKADPKHLLLDMTTKLGVRKLLKVTGTTSLATHARKIAAIYGISGPSMQFADSTTIIIPWRLVESMVADKKKPGMFTYELTDGRTFYSGNYTVVSVEGSSYELRAATRVDVIHPLAWANDKSKPKKAKWKYQMRAPEKQWFLLTDANFYYTYSTIENLGDAFYVSVKGEQLQARLNDFNHVDVFWKGNALQAKVQPPKGKVIEGGFILKYMRYEIQKSGQISGGGSEWMLAGQAVDGIGVYNRHFDLEKVTEDRR